MLNIEIESRLSQALVIDDSRATNLYHKAILREVLPGTTVESAVTVTAALEYLRSKDANGKFPSPELILIDLEMPHKNGFNFLDEYVKLSPDQINNFETLVIIVSNYLDFENFTKTKTYKHLGLHIQHIRKPARKEDLSAMIEDFYNNY